MRRKGENVSRPARFDELLEKFVKELPTTAAGSTP